MYIPVKSMKCQEKLCIIYGVVTARSAFLVSTIKNKNKKPLFLTWNNLCITGNIKTSKLTGFSKYTSLV